MGHLKDYDIGDGAPTFSPAELLKSAKGNIVSEVHTLAPTRERQGSVGRSAGIPSVEVSAPPTKAGNPRHKEDFNSLLGAAAQKRPQGDQT